MVKGHYALWARYYESEHTGQRYIPLVFSSFAHIGYKKAVHGGFKKERKQEAMRMLEALTTVEQRIEWSLKNGKRRRLRGRIWARRHYCRGPGRDGDLLGEAREGTPDMWEPIAFTYAPGSWFDTPTWKKHHKFIGKIGSGLMRLQNNTDEWAILIGGGIGTLVR